MSNIAISLIVLAVVYVAAVTALALFTIWERRKQR